MMLSDREIELFRRIIILSRDYDNMRGNTEPTLNRYELLESIAKKEVERLSFDIDEDDIEKCCELICGIYRI